MKILKFLLVIVVMVSGGIGVFWVLGTLDQIQAKDYLGKTFLIGAVIAVIGFAVERITGSSSAKKSDVPEKPGPQF